ncbi:MAG: type II toxin-antitoxin system RelE/ParE family toxin [Gammaproteobacteria bacterium]
MWQTHWLQVGCAKRHAWAAFGPFPAKVIRVRTCAALADAGAFLVHGFVGNKQDDIHDDERAAFRMLTAKMPAYDDAAIARAMANGTLMEVKGSD